MRHKFLFIYFFLSFFIKHTSFAYLPKTLSLETDKTSYFISREYVSYFEDKTNNKTLHDILSLQDSSFSSSQANDLINTNIHSSYWLKFRLENKSNKNHFRIELYDFDIDEIQFYLLEEGKLIESKSGGFLSHFKKRVVQHKNSGIDISIEKNAYLDIYIKIKSTKLNVLEPVVKHYSEFVSYGLKEYFLLGLFNGLMFLILAYNLIYFFILRTKHYFYYVAYGLSILIYLNTQNGIGFQFIWPQFPRFNLIASPISLSLSIIFILLFCKSYLKLESLPRTSTRIIHVAIILKIVLLFAQIYWEYEFLYNCIDFLFFQICLFVGFYVYRKEEAKLKWYLSSFLLLNIAIFISFGEKFDWIVSNIFTVYILNIGVILQFIFLSIGIAETIRDNDKLKNESLSQLLFLKEKNENLRISELKQQLNPHFIFNALNSIQSKILSDKKEEASKFLVSFSKLIRKNLEISDDDFISLEDEFTNLEHYLKLENMRLGNSIHYSFINQTDINLDRKKIPTFLLQPIVENAIWHGFQNSIEKHLLIIQTSKKDNILYISISDNGVGINYSKESKGNSKHQSKGLKLIHERLDLITKKVGKKHSLEIKDRSLKGEKGTEAIFTIEL